MKIDNKKNIRKRVRILVSLLVTLIILAAGFSVSRLYITNDLSYAAITFFVISIVFLFRNLLTLRYFDYEHSGEVISIKHYHPWEMGMIRPAIELPKYQIQSFDIDGKRSKSKLRLSVKGSKGKTFCYRCEIIDLSKDQIQKIKQSLQNI